MFDPRTILLYSRITTIKEKLLMNKLLFFILLTTTNLLFTSDPTAMQQKQTFTFSITLSTNHNPTYIGEKPSFDQQDTFACSILGIPWPQENKKLWRIDNQPYRETKNSREYSAKCMSIKEFTDRVITIPPLCESKLKGTFAFSQTLPDAFVKKMIENGGTTICETDKAIIHFVLKNQSEELEELGLLPSKKQSLVLSAIIPMGILSIFALFLYIKS